MNKLMTYEFPSVFAADAFDDYFGDMFRVGFPESFFKQSQGYPTDLVEVKDEAGNVTGYEVMVTLAGIQKEKIDVNVDGDMLSINVDKEEKLEDKSRNYLSKGISHRSMQLRYGLHGIDKGKIRADMKDGMLKVELPVAEESKPKKIEIG